MAPKQPLVKRIIIAFVLMTLVISGLFSVSIVVIVHYVEEQLVSNEMDNELSEILEQGKDLQNPLNLGTHEQFFASDITGSAIPPLFAGVEDGFSEVEQGDQAFYAYKRTINGDSYVLVQDQQLFEARENVLFYGVLASFLLSLLAAWAVGWLVARRVIAPVVRLAQQVRHRDQLLPLAPALAAEYANDEVGHLAQAFDNTLGQLRASFEREHLFTSDVSHELRTPLMIIASSCELLLEANHLNQNMLDQVMRISQASAEMRELVQTFLMLARGNQEESRMAASITLAMAAENQAKRWAAKFEDKGLTFSVIQQGAANPGFYNQIFLNTVISNLLRNALYYTETGTVRLVMDASGFSIEDTGIGIPIDQQQRIFQPFVRGTQARGEGSGLGLSLVKRICQHEGWQVSLSALPDQGSVFRIQLNPPL
ncbi:MAG TPA: HAMP domain-containing sensor histidine kinase [Methylophilaceae bacterium]|nr:HAMP domain-containing sensor histidine kinase [Methylophilaceae bacterium]